MRRVGIGLFLFAAAWAEVKISTSAKSLAVQPGTPIQFTANVPVIWSLAAGSQGSIDENGVYWPPDKLAPKQSLGGCQLLPDYHVFNTRIDDLPAHPKSDIWIKDSLAGIGGIGIKFGPAFPLNYVDEQVRPTQMHFLYTPQNDGPFRIPEYPHLRVESGFWTWNLANHDRHVITLDPKTCTVQELYNLYPAGFVRACPKCTSQSGVKYDMLEVNLPRVGTDAGGMQLLPLSFRLDELLAGAVNHALRFTIARPDRTWLWPATTSAYYIQSETKMPMGARVRLKADFDIETLKNPVSKVLATQLKQYGLILADAGLNWEAQGLLEKYPDHVRAAFTEVRDKINANHMEVVDLSGLMVSASSGETLAGRTVVIATSVENPQDTASVEVKLTAVAIGTLSPLELIQAGSDPKQLNVWISNTEDRRVAWSMSPQIGELSESGIYHAPASVDTAVTTTIMATSVADPSASTSIQVTILPPGVIRINAGDATDYVDTVGNTWWGDSVPERPAMGFNDGSYPYDFTKGFTWNKTEDGGLFSWGRASLNDIIFKMSVPNGKYKVTLKLAENGTEENLRRMHLETQGQVVYRDFDIFAAAGGSQTAIDVPMPAVVTDGTLYVAMRQRGKFPGSIDECCSMPIFAGGYGPLISALEIAPDPGRPAITVTPADGGTITVFQTQQFFAVPWYLDRIKLKWTLSPDFGSIDENGVYAPPLVPSTRETLVTVKASSADDEAISGTSVLRVAAGVPSIRINCGIAPSFTDANGNVWSSDYGFGPNTVAYWEPGVEIANASRDMQSLYQSARYRYENENFYYSFTVPNMRYRVTLKFADYTFKDAGRHIFDVKLNGVTVLSNFDSSQAAGAGMTAIDRSFDVLVLDRQLRIDFIGRKGGAMINGIEIVPILL